MTQVANVPGESIQFYYFNNGVLTSDSGEDAGTLVVFKLTYDKVQDVAGFTIGHSRSSSFAFSTGLALTTLKEFNARKADQASSGSLEAIAQAVTAGFAEGEWCLDHENGMGFGIKATTDTTDTADYKVRVAYAAAASLANGEVSTTSIGRVEGNIAHDASDASSYPVKIGFRAVSPSSMPSAVAANDRVDGFADLQGRQLVYLATALDSVNDTVGANPRASATIAGMDALVSAVTTLSNTATAVKASAGNLHGWAFRNTHTADTFVQWFDLATGSVTLGTTVPRFVTVVPANNGINQEFLPMPFWFATAITYAGTATRVGSGAPTVAIEVNGVFGK